MNLKIKNPKSRHEYVKKLKIAAPDTALTLQREAKNLDLTTSDKPKAFVAAANITSFTPMITPQQQEDVLNSMLLAQLGANYKHRKETQTAKWYNKYIEILTNLGWAIKSFDFQHYESSNQEIQISTAALDIINDIVSKKSRQSIITDSINALTKSSNNGETKIFSTNGSTRTGGNFQVSNATVGPDGNIEMALGASYFSTAVHEVDFLFFHYQRQHLNLFLGAQKVILVNDVYAGIREAVLEKLLKHSNKF